MTKVRFEGPIGGFSGSMGKMVFADQKKNGKTIAYMKSQQVPTEAKLERKACFLEASAWADVALKDPATYAFYEKAGRDLGKKTRNVAIGEYLCKPSIKPLDLSEYKGLIGNPIGIRVKDLIGMAEVNVEIRAQDGTVIETGQAVQRDFRPLEWKYTATKQVTLGSDVFIKIVGYNHVGTKAQITENPTVGADA
jgi:hypothetical protein